MADNPFQEIISELTVSREDATLINVLTEMGTSGDKSQYTRPGSSIRFSSNQLEILHENPIINAYCSALPDSAISKPLEFNFGNYDKDIDAKKSAEVVDWLSDFAVLEKTAKAQTFANVYGGAAIVYFVDDGQPQDQPLKLSKIKRVLGTRVFDRYRVIPVIESATTLEDIEHFHILTSGVSIEKAITQENYVKFHKSRIIPFYGLLLTDNSMIQRYEGWGKSMIEAIWESYRDYKTAILASSSNLNDSSLAVVSMDGFIELLRSNDVATIKKVFSSFKNMASNQGMVLMDKSKQSLSFVERQFAGVSQVVDKLREDFIGQTRIPHDKLFGESPSGLGATGEAEEKNWAKEVRQFQERRWRAALRKQYEILLSVPESPTKGKIPKQWTFSFPSIIELSEEQELANRSAQSTIDSTYQSIGVLTVDEIRQSRYGGAKFSYETTLDQEAYEEEKKKLEEQQAGFGGGFGGYGDLGALSDAGAASEEAPLEEVAVPEENTPVTQTDSLREDAMRPSCMDCVTKHLGSALIKGREVENGYPEHIILVVGELSEAEQEVEAISQEAADMIRDLRRDCWAKRRSPMFEEVLAIYDVLGYEWGEGDEEDDFIQEVEVPSYRNSFGDEGDEYVYLQDGKKLRRTRQGLTKKKVWVEGDEGRYQSTRWVKTGQSSPKRESSREKRATKSPETKERASTPRHLRPFRDLAEGVAIGLTRMEEDAILKNSRIPVHKIDRVKKLAKEGVEITDAEAHSLGTWCSDDYEPISRSLYSTGTFSKGNMSIGVNPDDTAEYHRAIAKATTNALQKIEPITKEGVYSSLERQKEQPLRLFDKTLDDQVEKGIGGLPSTILRYEWNKEARMAVFLDKVGKEVSMDSLFATTIRHDNDFAFSGDEKLMFEITPKWDGTGEGRYIDEVKTSSYEGEILYPPGTRFKVEEVFDPSEKSVAKLLEIQRNRQKVSVERIMRQEEIIKAFAKRKGMNNEDTARLSVAVIYEGEYEGEVLEDFYTESQEELSEIESWTFNAINDFILKAEQLLKDDPSLVTQRVEADEYYPASLFASRRGGENKLSTPSIDLTDLTMPNRTREEYRSLFLLFPTIRLREI